MNGIGKQFPSHVCVGRNRTPAHPIYSLEPFVTVEVSDDLCPSIPLERMRYYLLQWQLPCAVQKTICFLAAS